jgi:hypothetical protein
MKTLREIKQIDQYLRGKLRPELRLLFEARMLVDPLLKVQVDCQRKIYAIVCAFGRRKIKEEANRIHHRLFNDPSRIEFQQNILDLFKK